jgi:GntR family transcriptional repressor for pyruvate dehydrogenase complex
LTNASLNLMMNGRRGAGARRSLGPAPLTGSLTRVARAARADVDSGPIRPGGRRRSGIAGASRTPAGSSLNRALKTSETVARDIVHDIVSRGLERGDRLPPEAAMLEEYGVSRESLREGLRLLEVQGLITIRRGPGGGPSVGRVDAANLGRVATLYYHLAGGTYAELFDAWLISEPILAELAARNDDREAVRRAMSPFVAQPTGNLDGDKVDFVDSHVEFHAVVAELANNRVLELMLETTGQIVTHHVVVNADPRQLRDEIDHDHADIARAISAGHAKRARTLMENHIRAMVDHCSIEVVDPGCVVVEDLALRRLGQVAEAGLDEVTR